MFSITNILRPSHRMQRALPLSRCPRRLLVHSGLPFTGLLQNLLDIYTGRHRVDPAPKHYTARPTKGKKDLCCGSPHHDTAKLSLKASCGFALELVWFRLCFFWGKFHSLLGAYHGFQGAFHAIFTLFSRLVVFMNFSKPHRNVFAIASKPNASI